MARLKNLEVSGSLRVYGKIYNATLNALEKQNVTNLQVEERRIKIKRNGKVAGVSIGDDGICYVGSGASDAPGTGFNSFIKIGTDGTLQFSHGDSFYDIYTSKNLTPSTFLTTAGGTITGPLTVNGPIVSPNNITLSSDSRLKTNLAKLLDATDIINNLNGYRYKMNDEANIGVIAQEVQKVLPELVREDDEGYLSVAYQNLTAVLIEALKETNARVKVLEKRLGV